ncbi:MAG: hypothetical protein ACOYK8_00570 [Alphaproteobacteria bacterium]
MEQITSNRKHPPDGWHIDKTLNITVFIGLLAQAIFFSSYMGNLESRVSHLEADQLKDNAEREQAGRVDERLKNLEKGIESLQRQMSYIIEHLPYANKERNVP